DFTCVRIRLRRRREPHPCPHFFFFSSRRRHTRCLSDWSSDVCSSDLGGVNNLADRKYFTKRTTEYPGPGIIPAMGRSLYLSFGRSEERRVGKECCRRAWPAR